MADTAPKPAKVSPPPSGKPKSKDTPPPKSEKPKAEKPRGRPPELQKQLEDIFMTMGIMTAGAINEFDGEVIRDNAASLAESWHKVAQTNATVKRILQSMTETGAWSGAVMSTAAVAIPIMQNHGAIPDNIPHPFKKPPRITDQQPQPGAPDYNGPYAPPPGYVPPQPGSPVTPSQAKPPEPPPGQHKYSGSE